MTTFAFTVTGDAVGTVTNEYSIAETDGGGMLLEALGAYYQKTDPREIVAAHSAQLAADLTRIELNYRAQKAAEAEKPLTIKAI